jgi:hypothetical protein
VKLSNLVLLNALVAAGFGIAFALYGPLILAFFGVPDVEGGNALQYWQTASFARLFGAALFGQSFLLLSLRGVLANGQIGWKAQRSLAGACLLANAMGLFVAATQQASVWGTLAGWVMVGVFAFFTLGYSYFLLRKESETAGGHLKNTDA